MAERTIYEGRVVTMNGRSDVHDPGRVYVEGTTIVAVRPAAKPAPAGWDGARLVRTGDTIYPGLIELHNHLSYNALPLWQTPQRFTNRGQWMRHRDYRRFVSGPASVLGRTGGFLEAVVRYVEAKCLLGGVTTSQGIALASNMGIRRYYKGLVRNVEDTDDAALPAAATRVADVEAGSRQGVPEEAQPVVVAAAPPRRRRRRRGPRALQVAAHRRRRVGHHALAVRHPLRRAARPGLPDLPGPGRLDGVVAAVEPAALRRHRRHRAGSGRGPAGGARVRLVAVGVEEPAGRDEGGVAGVRGPRRGVHAATSWWRWPRSTRPACSSGTRRSARSSRASAPTWWSSTAGRATRTSTC